MCDSSKLYEERNYEVDRNIWSTSMKLVGQARIYIWLFTPSPNIYTPAWMPMKFMRGIPQPYILIDYLSIFCIHQNRLIWYQKSWFFL